jgi:uncharacterized protein
MSATRLLTLALLLFAAASVCAAAEPATPSATGYVTDTAGVLGEWAAKTDTLCRDIERQTTSEVAVLTVPTTAPLDAQQYAQQVFDRWKVGKKGKDNGVLVLLAVGDRKMWIATGYGVEGVLPDGKAGEIRDRLMLPLFRQKRYGEGVYMGVASIGNILSEGKIAAPKAARKGKACFRRSLILAIAAFFVIRPAAVRGLAGTGRVYYGGGAGSAEAVWRRVPPGGVLRGGGATGFSS